MKDACDRCSGRNYSQDPWEIMGAPIPQTFPNRYTFLKMVGLGIAITVAQYALLSLLIIRH